jgi:hypothetical protein
VLSEDRGQLPAGRNNQFVAIFDPFANRDQERDEVLGAAAARVEIRPAERVAWLAMRSLACPECGVPIAISRPVAWSEPLACAFCETTAPTRDFIQDQGWPAVDLIARIG